MLQEKKIEPKTDFANVVLYAIILCVHYPLRICFFTYGLIKETITLIISLPIIFWVFSLTTLKIVWDLLERNLTNLLSHLANIPITLTKTLVQIVLHPLGTVINICKAYATAFFFLPIGAIVFCFTITKNFLLNMTNVVVQKLSSLNILHGILTRCQQISLLTFLSCYNMGKYVMYYFIFLFNILLKGEIDYKDDNTKQPNGDLNGKFQSKHHDLQQEIAKIKDSLSLALQKSADCNKELKDKLKQLSESNTKLDKERAECKQEIELERQNLQQEISVLKEALTSTLQESAKLSNKLMEKQEQLNEAIAKFDKERSESQREIETERQNLQQEISKLKDALTVALQEGDSCKKELKKFDEERVINQQEIETECQSLRENISNLKDALTVALNESASCKRELNDTQKYLSEANDKLDKERATYKQENESIRLNVQQDIAALKDALDKALQKNESLGYDLNNQQKQLTEATLKFDKERAQYQQEIEKVTQNQNDTRTQMSNTFNNERKKLQEEVQRLQNLIAEVQKESEEEYKLKKQEAINLDNERNQLQEQIQTLQQQVVSLQKQYETNSLRYEETIKDQKNQFEEERNLLCEKNKTLEDKVAELERTESEGKSNFLDSKEVPQYNTADNRSGQGTSSKKKKRVSSAS